MPRRIDVDDDDAPAERIQRAAEHPAGLAVAGHQHERLVQATHLARERCTASAWRKARPAAARAAYRPHTPADHGEVDAERDPQPLPSVKAYGISPKPMVVAV